MSNRDEFRKSDADILAKRVGGRCSNPGCRKSTTGPKDDPSRAVNIGVAAHITAAALGGPRFDPSLSSDERKSVENGVWLCQNCAKLVDNDPSRYTVATLRSWKNRAEENARLELEGTSLSEHARTIVDLVLERRNESIRQDRHEYRLEASVNNVGTSILRNYHVDLEIPTPVLIDTTGRVEVRSDQQSSLFRMVWRDGSDDVFPGDQKIVFCIPYYMDHKLFENRGDLFAKPVRAALYEGGHRLVYVEQSFDDFQIF
jgi:hypothetical protein